jgi:hypothetical protein
MPYFPKSIWDGLDERLKMLRQQSLDEKFEGVREPYIWQEKEIICPVLQNKLKMSVSVSPPKPAS